MGTQQILLIVLSVIIVGIAVAVGITMFNSQASSSNRQAVIGDMNNLAASALSFYKTPSTHGGGGNSFGAAGSEDTIGAWIGFDYTDATNTCSTSNGSYVITCGDNTLTIVGTGTEIGNDGTNNVSATMVITGSTGGISTTIGN
ncbi:MAG: hypothetical protein B1H06_01570 [Candidatus Cloacimonas sp. 4484_143]|nr:MAG: hypothetical protein B1H06_01570 [Candidatus Cloacimonas sp. 4484_143]RLC58569.1 MAG: hypothetical protein DRH89_00735 [Candidatus Cloacimonadota bacterium]